MMLSLESVRLFVLVAEYGNMTRAAEAAGTVQPVVSQRIKSLEELVGRRLFDRTPRSVRLTSEGELFLARARTLLAAHDAALDLDIEPAEVVSLAVSDHTLGTSFDLVLRHLRASLPTGVAFTLRLGQSAEIRELFDRGVVDLAIVRRDGASLDGEVLGEDPIEWWAAANQAAEAGPLRLVLLPEPCGVRGAAIKALDSAAIPWRETFVGGSCLALSSAVRAGIGIAPLGRIVGGDLAGCVVLPDLPVPRASKIVMLTRTHSTLLQISARALSASVREMIHRTQHHA